MRFIDIVACVYWIEIVVCPKYASDISLSTNYNSRPGYQRRHVGSDNPTGSKNRVLALDTIRLPESFPVFEWSNFTDRCSRPSLGYAVGDGYSFVARKAEADEPLLVEHPGRLFQQPNPSAVVLDQVVVCAEYGNYGILNT